MIDELGPYPAYQDSGVAWLGEVPEHWELRRVKQAFRRIVGGSTPSTAEASYWDGDVVWVTPYDVSRAERLSQSQRRITREGLASCSSELVPPPTLIVTSRAPVGNVAMALVAVCTNQGCKALVVDDRITNPVFGFHVLRMLKPELQSLATGTTFTEISTSKLGSVPIPVPPLPEQAAIVRFLDHADWRIRRYIAAKKTLIALLNEQKQAIIHRSVTRGLDPDVHFKPSGVEWLGDVPEHWKVVRTRYVLREVDSRSAGGEETHLSMSQKLGLVPSSMLEQHTLVSESYAGGKLCEAGDLVLNRLKAHLGVFALASQSGVISPDYTVLRQIHPLSMRYCELIFRSPAFRGELRIRAKGIVEGFWRLYTDDFYDIRIPLPPLMEQEHIIAEVESELTRNEAAARGAEREISLLHEYRTRMIADVVTGKLDVREAAAQLPEEVEPLEAADALLDGDESEDEADLDTVAGESVA